jgi:hypothetical protein
MAMSIMRAKMLIVVFLLAVPSVAKAQDQTSPTYTKSEVDAKISELRALYAQGETRSDADAKFEALRSLLDQNARLAEQHLEAAKQNIDAFESNIAGIVGQNEQADQQRAQKIFENVAAFEHSNERSAYFGPLLAALIGALISAAVLLLLKHFEGKRQGVQDRIEKDRKDSEKRREQIESTLEFSRRFGELLQLQSKLNQAYDRARSTAHTQDDPPTALETNEARIWWWLFFDLLLYEYDFFKQDLVWKERFKEWIRWRWYDAKATGNDMWKTCGMDYQTGWKNWKEKPANRKNRLVEFLERVHQAQDVAAVERIVEEEPRLSHDEYRLGERDRAKAPAAAT